MFDTCSDILVMSVVNFGMGLRMLMVNTVATVFIVEQELNNEIAAI